MFTRRQFLKLAATAGAALAMPLKWGTPRVSAEQTPQLPLPGEAIPQFVDLVPNLLDSEHLIVDDGTPFELEMREHVTRILPAGAVPGYAGTHGWSYLKPGQATRASYIGPVVLATRGQPTEVTFTNLLGDADDTNVLAYKHATDQTLHWADPLNDEENHFAHMAGSPLPNTPAAENYDGPIPAVVHLHGGEVPPGLDGGPDGWYTSDGEHVGHGYYSKDGDDPKNYATYHTPTRKRGR